MRKWVIILILAFLLISIRIFYLNFYLNDYYTKLFNNKTNLYVYGESSERGKIFDVNGKVLVDNVGIKEIYFQKNNYLQQSDEIEIAYKLASILDIEEANINNQQKFWLIINNSDLLTEEEKGLFKERKLSLKEVNSLKEARAKIDEFSSLDKKAAHIYYLMNKDYEYQKKVIKKNVSEEEYAQVMEANLKGITGEISWERTYPYDDSLRSILGFIGPIYKENKDEYLEKGYTLADIVGLSSLELEYEDYLKGSKAIYKVNSDGTLKLIKEEEKGSDLYLSIDIDIQKKLEEESKKELLLSKEKPNTEYFKEVYSAIGNPSTGEIIAILGIRLNDNHTFSDVTSNIISSSYTVGSVVKGASITVGYNYDLIKEKEKIKDGCIKLFFNPEKCSWKYLGYLDDLKALEQSSNYYQFQLAIKLLNLEYKPNMKLNVTNKEFQIYRDAFQSFGLGTKTGIDLPNEKEGGQGNKIADDLYLNLTIGQYDTYTPISLLQYINCFASKKRLKLNLVNKIIKKDEVISYEPIILNDINISDENFTRIKLGLSHVALYGTGKNVVNNLYNPIAKTGTAQSFYDKDDDGIIDTSTRTTSLVALAPLDNPKYSLAIVAPNVAHPNQGSTYIYRITNHLSRTMTDFLFLNY